MALFRVMFRNKYYSPGTFLETVDDEESMVQPVNMMMEAGHFVPEANYGIIVPLREVKDYCIKILKRGLDKRW